ncbi:MAG: ABC transporter ATP-binding protein [Gammaproteobacteria bacterium]|nr:ABC transporter ATP-binding protein [Gammaproteobacteria bacterium]NNC67353.1 ABC transporter ATP-binding protein [Gammaproteobacteria bacterium]
MTQEILLSVKDLSRSFNGQKAIEDINFNIHRGEVVALLGTNGAGKSTTLNIITGNLAADSGEVSICDTNIATHPKQAKYNMGYLPDTPPLYRELTVNEYLQFAARIHGVNKQDLSQRVDHVIEVCGLSSVTKKLIANLSKGFKQRVGIAQAIIHNPALVILDEPTVGLDPVQMQDIRTLLNELSKNHSVLLSTHLLAEAETTCNRVLIIDKGSLLLDQTLEELNQSPGKRVKLRFNGNPEIDELNAIPGCESVSCSQFGKYICRYTDMQFIQQVQARSLENDWQLYEIASFGGSLEQVFLDLVVRDSIASPAA